MVIEARQNARKQQFSMPSPSPFAHKSNPSNEQAQNRFKEVDSILKNPQKQMAPKNTQNVQLPNQYSGNQIVINQPDIDTQNNSTLTASVNQSSAQIKYEDLDENPAIVMANFKLI